MPVAATTILGFGFHPLNLQPGIVPLTWEAVAGALTEIPTSPDIDLGEHATFTKTFRGSWNTCVAARINPGQYVADGEGNLFRMLSCKLKKAKGERGFITFVNEWVSGPTLAPPPDKYENDPAEFNPAVERNPNIIDPDTGITLDDVIRARQSVQAPQILARGENAASPYNPDTPQDITYQDFVRLLRQGTDTYYLAGMKLTWTRYYFTPQLIDRGGYTQVPGSDAHGDIIPSSFIRNNVTNDLVIPGDDNFSWLRVSDKVNFGRDWFEHIRTWIGGPDGHFDPLLYDDYFTGNQATLEPPNWATNPATY